MDNALVTKMTTNSKKTNKQTKKHNAKINSLESVRKLAFHAAALRDGPPVFAEQCSHTIRTVPPKLPLNIASNNTPFIQ